MFDNDCACARAREGLYSSSPSPALPESMVESIGGGVGKNEAGSFMLEATPMMTVDDDIDCPYWTLIGDPGPDHPLDHGPLF